MEALSLEPWKVWNTHFVPRNCGKFPPAHSVPAARGSTSGTLAAVAGSSRADEPLRPTRARQHLPDSRGQSVQARPPGSGPKRSAARGAAGAGDAPDLRKAPWSRLYPHFPGERGDASSCPPPLPLSSPPKAGDFPLPRAQSLACGGFGERIRRWPRIPSFPGLEAPSAQSVRGVQKELRRFGLPPARTLALSGFGSGGGGRRRLLGISRIKRGCRSVADARSTYGCTP